MKTALLLLLVLMPGLPAQDTEVPAPVTMAQFSELLERPPFRRVLALTDALTLSGIASLPDRKMVTVWNRVTRESFIVTDQPNAQGWRLMNLTESSDLKGVAAVIASADQSITLRFDPERLTPPKLDNTSRPAARDETQTVVEALLRALDTGTATSFNALPPVAQESFRKSFTGFLGSYPSASDGERLDFARKTLTEISDESDSAGTGTDAANRPESLSPPIPPRPEK